MDTHHKWDWYYNLVNQDISECSSESFDKKGDNFSLENNFQVHHIALVVRAQKSIYLWGYIMHHYSPRVAPPLEGII